MSRPTIALPSLAAAMTEDELLAGITGALASGGWLYQHVRRSDLAVLMGHVGFPDIVAVHAERGLFAMFELKTATGRVERWQQRWLDALAAAGIDARVVRPADYDALLPWILGDRGRVRA